MDNREIDRRIKFLMEEINELKKSKEIRAIIPIDLAQNAYEVLVDDDLKSLSSLIRRCLFGEYYHHQRFDGTQFLYRKPVKRTTRMNDMSNDEYDVYCFAFKQCFNGIVNAISKLKNEGVNSDVAETDEQAGHGDVPPGEPGPVPGHPADSLRDDRG